MTSTRPRMALDLAPTAHDAKRSADPARPLAPQKDESVDQHPREVVPDERGPHPDQMRAERAGEEPGKRHSEAPIADRGADQRRHGVSGAPKDAAEREV